MSDPDPTLAMLRTLLDNDPGLRDTLRLVLDESPLAMRRDWPYADLPLACPMCPVCGAEANMLVGGNLHPIAFCPNDDCMVFQYDPTKPALHNLRNAGQLIESTTEDGSTVWSVAPEAGS